VEKKAKATTKSVALGVHATISCNLQTHQNKQSINQFANKSDAKKPSITVARIRL